VQYVTGDFPVLSGDPTPRTPLEQWSFAIGGAIDEPVSWQWHDLLALPSETVTVDIHCVTKWSKLGTSWKGVAVDTLREGVDSEAQHVTAWCDGGYTTNLALEDVTNGRAWVAYEFGGEPLKPEHGRRAGSRSWRIPERMTKRVGSGRRRDPEHDQPPGRGVGDEDPGSSGLAIPFERDGDAGVVAGVEFNEHVRGALCARS
jgi:hypothetical protein